MKQNKQKINKLFYNKWAYKICCKIQGASQIKYYGATRIRLWTALDYELFFEDSLRYSWNNRTNFKISIDKVDVAKFVDAVEPFMEMKEDVQIRVEGSSFNLFCKDLDLKNQIEQALYPWVVETVGPDSEEELKFILENKYKIICNKLPYEKFKFKVVFKDWIKNPATKEKLHSYILKLNPEDIKISPTTKKWLEGRLSYQQEPFLYLVDAKHLVFMRLISTDIKRVYEYVEQDNINTSL